MLQYLSCGNNNNAINKMGIFKGGSSMKACLFGGEVKNKYLDRATNLNQVGLNTGNMLFWYSLKSILDLDQVAVAECIRKSIDISAYSAFITTDLIWIQENTVYPVVQQQLQLVGDRPLVPISIGLQCGEFKSDFKLHPDTIRLISELQERSVLAVRGRYTAEILNQNGIRNIQVIGCPSMYFPFDYHFAIKKKSTTPKLASANMRSMYSELKIEEVKFLVYCANHKFTFCEQTAQPFTPDICKDISTYNYLNKWLNTHKMMFFDVEDWRNYMSSMDFSLGCRFHGNVIALWEGIPSLFITVDSRTRELCEHFSLPTISMREFDADKDIQYYYDLADYMEFNKTYANRLDEFICFLKANDLPIKKKMDIYYDRRIDELRKKFNCY